MAAGSSRAAPTAPGGSGTRHHASSSRELYTDSRVDNAEFTPDGRYLLVSHQERPAELWDVASATLVRVLDGSTGGITASFSADGRLMLAAAEDADRWSASASGTSRPAILLRTFTYAVRQRRHPVSDGRYVVIGLDVTKDNLPIFDAATGERLRVIDLGTWRRHRHRPSRQTAAISSPAAATTSHGSSTSRRGEIRELTGHTNIIWGTAFSPDGRWALTGSQDRTARLWDVATGTGDPALREPSIQRHRRGRLLGRRPDDRYRQLRWLHPADADRPPGPGQLDVRSAAARLRALGTADLRDPRRAPDMRRDDLDLDARALGQRGDPDRRACRRRIADEPPVDAR